MFECVCLAVMCGLVGFAGWEGGSPERRIAVTILGSWGVFVGLAWVDARLSWVSLAASDIVLTVGMGVCARLDADHGTHRWIGLIRLVAGASMVFGGLGGILQAIGVGLVAFNVFFVNQLTSAGALAVLVLATVRRMALNAEEPRGSDLDLGRLPPETLAIQ
jgi:hypothetical protein